jgi:hypothetical protein
MCTNTHTHTHTYTNTYTHSHTQTHTHTHMHLGQIEGDRFIDILCETFASKERAQVDHHNTVKRDLISSKET